MSTSKILGSVLLSCNIYFVFTYKETFKLITNYSKPYVTSEDYTNEINPI